MKRRFGSAGGIACVAGVCALGAVVAAHATETLTLTTVIPAPGGGKFTSFDISFVDTTLNYYLLGDRTGNAVQVVNTNTNTIILSAGQGLFTGNTGNNNTSGPDGVMTVLHREIWVDDGDSTLKFLSLANGVLLGQVSTGGQFRVDEMCYDPVHNIGFVANNADTRRSSPRSATGATRSSARSSSTAPMERRLPPTASSSASSTRATGSSTYRCRKSTARAITLRRAACPGSTRLPSMS